MNPEINTALVVLGVGMITVFVILGLVVLSGDLLIRIVNRYFPAEVIKSPAGDVSPRTPLASANPKNQKTTVAAIVAAVDLITGGKGKADKIEKID